MSRELSKRTGLQPELSAHKPYGNLMAFPYSSACLDSFALDHRDIDGLLLACIYAEILIFPHCGR